MKYLVTFCIALICCCYVIAGGVADTTTVSKKDTTNQGILDWLANNHFMIRKGFSPSTSDNAQPASFFWYKDLTTQFHYTLVDFAIQQKGVELFRKSLKSTMTLYPSFEWHKNGDTSSGNKNNKNTLTAGGNIQYMYSISPKCFPFITGSVNYKDDYLKKIETINLSGYVSLFCKNSFLPGSMKVRYASNSQIIFRYYPYMGIESYKSTKSSSQSTTYWASRISLELNPLPRHFQIVADYTYRAKLADNLYKQGDVYWFTSGLNYYFDPNRRIGFGIDYCKGYDPNNSFTKTEKIDLGFKLKV